MFALGKKKRYQLMEWVEKESFDRLNKLFVISACEYHHQTLLTNHNLLLVVWEPQPYVFPILPRIALKVLVFGKHPVLRDLPFYKEAWAADAKAR